MRLSSIYVILIKKRVHSKFTPYTL